MKGAAPCTWSLRTLVLLRAERSPGIAISYKEEIIEAGTVACTAWLLSCHGASMIVRLIRACHRHCPRRSGVGVYYSGTCEPQLPCTVLRTVAARPSATQDGCPKTVAGRALASGGRLENGEVRCYGVLGHRFNSWRSYIDRLRAPLLSKKPDDQQCSGFVSRADYDSSVLAGIGRRAEVPRS